LLNLILLFDDAASSPITIILAAASLSKSSAPESDCEFCNTMAASFFLAFSNSASVCFVSASLTSSIAFFFSAYVAVLPSIISFAFIKSLFNAALEHLNFLQHQ
jgi:hypothetical protein